MNIAVRDASIDASALAKSERASSHRTLNRPLLRAAVLGAGTMGSRIVAHLANAGLPVLLLDIVSSDAPASDPAQRNRLAMQALEALKTAKPAAFFDSSLARLISVGNFEDDLSQLGQCDWVVEAVAENLAIKQSLLQKIAPHLSAHAIVTTNTSGLPVAEIAAQMPTEFQQRWFGAHFFNPPRYMRLVELIPTQQTDPALLERIAEFCDKHLGKTVVRAKDTPNFIANRIGTFAMLNTCRLMLEQGLTIEEVDALTGTAIGWPKTGTFRLADLVGVDVLGHVAMNFSQQAAKIGDERTDVRLPVFLTAMLERKWLGDKTKQGFYKKDRDADGKELRLALDWKTLEYHPAARAKFPELEMAKNIEGVGERIRTLLDDDPRKSKAAAFYWPMLTELWTYAANRIPEIADDIVAIDRAMQAGFNWELGPLAMWDAAGVPETVAKMRAEGRPISVNVEKLLAAGHRSWYRDDPAVASGKLFFDPIQGSYKPVTIPAGTASVEIFKKSHGVVMKNPGASLVDLGDGVAVIEFHTKMNAIGGDIVRFITQTLHPQSAAVADFEAFVISGDAANFSVGANIMQLLLAMQDEEWDDIDQEIRAFQGMTAAIKFCPRPVIVAPFGMCLGGGTEVCLHAAQRQAHAELYMGLVETGVGLVPGGGGCKEMALRAIDSAGSIRPGKRGEPVELGEAIKNAFETIAMAKVTTSVTEARGLGFLNAGDGTTMNRDRLLLDAKTRARTLVDAGYAPAVRRTDILVPGDNILATLKLGVYLMRQGGYISDHDVKVANHVAHVLCGGNVLRGTKLTEQTFLDLEREAFLSLCGEKKTQERIAFTLKTGKPLRN